MTLKRTADRAARLTVNYLAHTEYSYFDIYDPEQTFDDTRIANYYYAKLKKMDAGDVPKLPTEDELKNNYVKRCMQFADYDETNGSFYDPMEREWKFHQNSKESLKSFFLRAVEDRREKKKPLPPIAIAKTLRPGHPESDVLDEKLPPPPPPLLRGRNNDVPPNFTTTPPFADDDRFDAISPWDLRRDPSPEPKSTDAISSLYCLKMRDALRTMRRFLGIDRIFEGMEKEHGHVRFVKGRDEVDVYHPFFAKKNKSSDDIVRERLKRCMKTDRIKAFQFLKNLKENT